jgi:hypothetical protein
MKETPAILIGNSFPLSLIRRAVRIEPCSLEELHAAAESKTIISFWGHKNSLKQAEQFCGLSLRSQTARPVIQLSQDGLPSLAKQIFIECWVLSPEYIENMRPDVGQEMDERSIRDWRILKITWEFNEKI